MNMPVKRDSFFKSDNSKLSRRGFLRSAGIMGGLALAPSPLLAQALKAGATTQFPRLAAEMQRYVSEGKVASMLGYIGFGSAPAQSMAYGHLSMESELPVDENTLWRVYSMTKPITGMAVMMLIEEGKIKLDQPVADFIPEFAQMKVLTDPDNSLNAAPAKTVMTIRHLLTHTSGLGYTIIDKGPIRDEYLRLGLTPGALSKKPLPGVPESAPVPPIDEFARRVASLPLINQPGTKWHYSISLDLMGYIIQLASGVEFGQFLQQRIFDPLGMKSSYFTVPESEIGRLSDNYVAFAGMLLPVDPAHDSIFTVPPSFPYGGAGLVCSAYDYDRFLQMLVGRGAIGDVRIMSEQSALLGMSNLLPEGASTAGTWVEGHGFGAGGRVGLGTETSPKGTFGWSGAAGTVGFVDTLRGMRAGAYTQYLPADAYPFQREFTKLVYADLAAAGS